MDDGDDDTKLSPFYSLFYAPTTPPPLYEPARMAWLLRSLSLPSFGLAN